MTRSVQKFIGATLLVTPLSCALEEAGDLFGGRAGGAGETGSAATSGSAGSAHGGADGGWGDEGCAGETGAPDAAPAHDGPCTPLDWCLDADSDGFGDPGSRVTACAPPAAGFITDHPETPCTDCFDQSAEVHPGSSACVIAGFGGGASFDTNCDGEETECGPKAADKCGGTVGLCSGGGYLPEGSGKNPYCGSSTLQKCDGLGCGKTIEQTDAVLGCR